LQRHTCHHALLFEANREIIKALLQAYPEALVKEDYQGWLPLHFALRFKSRPHIVEELLKASPRTARMEDKYGDLPLHFALHFGPPSRDIINLLVDYHPRSISIKNKSDKLPEDLVDDPVLRDMLCGPRVSLSSKQIENNKIYIINRTGREVFTKFTPILPPLFQQDIGANLGIATISAGMKSNRTEHTHSMFDSPGNLIIQPGMTEPFAVPKDYIGIQFDFYCNDDVEKNTDEIRTWVTNNLIEKGTTGELKGQPKRVGVASLSGAH
jgi:hypothetical protein